MALHCRIKLHLFPDPCKSPHNALSPILFLLGRERSSKDGLKTHPHRPGVVSTLGAEIGAPV